MSHHPLFSVVLPTYNRASHLSSTIKTILNQDLKDFELLILDDASTDTTESVVRSFNDKRIVYIKNKENIRVAANVKKGFLLAKGEFIFTMGDDDLILYVNTFSTIYKEMKKTNAGFGQTGLIYFEKDYRHPCFLDHVVSEVFYLQPSKDILLKTSNWHYGFISGNIFRNSLIKADDLLDNDIWWIYFKVVYRSLLKSGGVYFGNHFVLAKISLKGNISYINIDYNKGFHLDKLFEIYKTFDHSPERFEKFKNAKLDIVVQTLPGIKFYTSNKNILKMMHKLLEYRPGYIFKFSFWMYTIIALLTPRFILGFLRPLRIKRGENNLSAFTKTLQIDKNIKF